MINEKWEQHIIVQGSVQGVFFRASTKKIADQMHLKGWVKNLRNGDVEICIEGERKEAENLVNELKKEPLPRIKKVSIESKTLHKKYTSFDIVF